MHATTHPPLLQQRSREAEEQRGKGSDTCLLLELLMNSIQRILDGDALQIASRDLESEREMQVDALDGRGRQVFL